MADEYSDGDHEELEILAESDSYAVLRGKDEEGEVIYNVELGTLTLHLFLDEWEELVGLIQAATAK